MSRSASSGTLSQVRLHLIKHTGVGSIVPMPTQELAVGLP